VTVAVNVPAAATLAVAATVPPASMETVAPSGSAARPDSAVGYVGPMPAAVRAPSLRVQRLEIQRACRRLGLDLVEVCRDEPDDADDSDLARLTFQAEPEAAPPRFDYRINAVLPIGSEIADTRTRRL